MGVFTIIPLLTEKSNSFSVSIANFNTFLSFLFIVTQKHACFSVICTRSLLRVRLGSGCWDRATPLAAEGGAHAVGGIVPTATTQANHVLSYRSFKRYLEKLLRLNCKLHRKLRKYLSCISINNKSYCLLRTNTSLITVKKLFLANF